MMVLNFAKRIVYYKLILDLIHYECSAFTGGNVDEIFTSLTKHIINKIENGIIEPSSVISSYANTVKNLSSSSNCDKKKGEEFN
jgi:Ras-related protein Rab-4B